MGKTILFVHGRNFKPRKADLKRVWTDSVAHGIARDRPGKLPRWEAVTKELVYYGDLSNEFLWGEGRAYDIAADTRSRRVTLDDLKAWPSNGFTKARYRKLPGKTALKEFFAGSLSRPLNWFGLSDELIAVVAPDMAHYWNLDSEFGTEARLRLSVALRGAFDRGDRVMIVAHSLGSIIAYDVLWKLSRSAEFRDYWSKRIDLLVTLGSPLGDETVKDRLRGRGATNERRYPANIRRWVNIYAEDDFISHDGRLRNDYKKMWRAGLVDPIQDHRIYNLALRNGRSNPHTSSGYLVHPRFAELAADWV